MTHARTARERDRFRLRLGRIGRRAVLLLALGALAGPPLVVDAQQQKTAPKAKTQPKAKAKAPAKGKAAPTRPARRAQARPPARPATPPPPPATAPRSAAALANDLAVQLAAGTRSGRWGVLVTSLTRGDTLFGVNPDEPMVPASTMKLVTAVMAFDEFGADHRFQTEVLRDGRLREDGTLEGNIVLRGTGDPAFSHRWVRGGPDVPLDLLASLVTGAGVRRVTGRVIGDHTAFEERLIPEGWKEDYLHLAYAAPVSALSVNENVVWISVSPGATGGAAHVRFEPASSGVPLLNSVTTRAGGGGAVSVVRRPDGGLEARGWIGQGAPTRRLQMVIDDPPRFTTGAFREALVRAGVEVAGGIELGPTPRGAEVIAALPSPPLNRLVSIMNRESVNHYAELLFRNAARGADGRRTGSAESADQVLREFFTRRLGAPPTAIVAADGSGLSPLDRVTPRAMNQLLAYAHEAPWGPAFHASLPVAGESELLRNRMRFTAAHGNLHAKTGTTNEVIGLAGYTTAENGEVIAFTFLYNGADRWNARATIDLMGATLSAFARQ